MLDLKKSIFVGNLTQSSFRLEKQAYVTRGTFYDSTIFRNKRQVKGAGKRISSIRRGDNK